MQGIMFTEDLFRKVITGEKTVTRRTGGLKNINTNPDIWFLIDTSFLFTSNALTRGPVTSGYRAKPRYKVGETVFLKEPCGRISGIMFYKFDYPKDHKWRNEFKGWGNKMFMKAENARYKVQITDVRIERAQDITEEEAIKEGFANIAEFQTAWMKINGISSWKKNPYVFVYSFKRI